MFFLITCSSFVCDSPGSTCCIELLWLSISKLLIIFRLACSAKWWVVIWHFDVQMHQYTLFSLILSPPPSAGSLPPPNSSSFCSYLMYSLLSPFLLSHLFFLSNFMTSHVPIHMYTQFKISAVYIKYLFIISYMWMLFLLVCLYHMHAWGPWRQEEGVGFPGTAITDSCKLLCGFQELNPERGVSSQPPL